MTSLMLAVLCGCAAHEATKSPNVRLRFVPAETTNGSGGASWSALHPAPDGDPGVWMAIAHAGIGDSFPVREEGGPTLFDVVVTAGDDDHLLLDLRSPNGSQRVDIRRDKSVFVRIAGSRYGLAYPSVSVAAGGRTTTGKAMLLVHRFP